MVERYRPLIEENAISSQEYDAAIAASREAEANVAQIQAQLEAAACKAPREGEPEAAAEK